MRKGLGGSSTLKKSYLTGCYTRIFMKTTKTSLVISLITIVSKQSVHNSSISCRNEMNQALFAWALEYSREAITEFKVEP